MPLTIESVRKKVESLRPRRQAVNKKFKLLRLCVRQKLVLHELIEVLIIESVHNVNNLAQGREGHAYAKDFGRRGRLNAGEHAFK